MFALNRPVSYGDMYRIRSCARLFFFFQAEDGIRDYKVTGVQTCALPISEDARPARRVDRRVQESDRGSAEFRRRILEPREPQDLRVLRRGDRAARGGRGEIGRASCRERV